MKKKSFYITTTIPYVNADPHIGFALELVQSDAVARHRRLAGRDVFFSTGTDEYGQKIWEASKREGKRAQDYVENYAQKFLNLKKTLNLSTDNFIRTTSPEHIAAAQEFWRLCDKNGDIYKKKYKGLYCVGCEKFITERDLVDGKCAIHPNLTPEIIEEENYFFKITKYRNDLLKYLQEPKSVLPEWRRKEAVDFTQNAMEDFSVSRSKERLSWGIPVPGDDTQVMYVWFGAFVNYLSTLGWPHSTKASRDKPEDLFKKFWLGGEKVQTAGNEAIYRVEKFIEKPDIAAAEKFLQEKNYLWNPTLIIAKTEYFLSLYEKHLPEMFEKLQEINIGGEIDKIFPQIKSISIDYGILEKEKEMLVLPADFGWADIGHWRAVWDLLATGGEDNVEIGKHIHIDSRGNLIYSSSGKLVATVGLSNMLIVETEDAIMMCPKDRAQEVKRLVKKLEEEGMEKYL